MRPSWARTARNRPRRRPGGWAPLRVDLHATGVRSRSRLPAEDMVLTACGVDTP